MVDSLTWDVRGRIVVPPGERPPQEVAVPPGRAEPARPPCSNKLAEATVRWHSTLARTQLPGLPKERALPRSGDAPIQLCLGQPAGSGYLPDGSQGSVHAHRQRGCRGDTQVTRVAATRSRRLRLVTDTHAVREAQGIRAHILLV